MGKMIFNDESGKLYDLSHFADSKNNLSEIIHDFDKYRYSAELKKEALMLEPGIFEKSLNRFFALINVVIEIKNQFIDFIKSQFNLVIEFKNKQIVRINKFGLMLTRQLEVIFLRFTNFRKNYRDKSFAASSRSVELLKNTVSNTSFIYSQTVSTVKQVVPQSPQVLLRAAAIIGLVTALILPVNSIVAFAEETQTEVVSTETPVESAPTGEPTDSPSPEPSASEAIEVGSEVIVEETPVTNPSPSAEPSPGVTESASPTPSPIVSVPLVVVNAPTNLNFTPVVEGIKLTWDKTDSEIDKYIVKIEPDNRQIDVSKDANELLIADLDRKATYSFSILAVFGEVSSEVIGPITVDLSTVKFPRPPMNAEVGGLIVKFEDQELSSQDLTNIADTTQLQPVSLEVSSEIATDTHLVEFNQPVDVNTANEIADALEANNSVEYAELDFAFLTANEDSFVPNDPLYATKQWSLWGNFGVGIADSPTGLALAYQNSTGLGSVIAVIDTGFTNHPDLEGQFVSGYDFVSNNEMLSGIREENGNPVPYDGDYIDQATYGPIGWDNNPQDPGDWNSTRSSSWHGTYIAGLISAKTNNGIGIAGIAPDAKIQPIRAFSWRGGLLSDVIASISWASGGSIENVPANQTPAKVINLSFSIEAPCTPSLQQAINEAIDRGSVVVAAAGNNNQDAANFAPGNCQNVITVGAINSDGEKANYSNFGSSVDISAPGGELDGQAIYSTNNEGTTSSTNPAYSVKQGTSIATALVSAAIAKLAQTNPTDTATQLRARVLSKNSTKPFPSGSCLTDENCGIGYLFFDVSTVQVSVFTYDGLNGSAGSYGCDVENDNLKEIINSISGYSVDASITSFSNATALRTKLDASRFFFMTDMETQNPSLTSFLPNDSKVQIADWVNDGGVMVMTGTYGAYDVNFLNTIFSWDLSSASGSSWSQNYSNTTGTPFANSQNGRASPATLTNFSATDSISKGTVANFKSMWGTDSNATVAVIQYGDGYVIFMGYDFYNTGKSGNSTGSNCSAYDNDWVKHTIPAALNYASQLSDASLSNITSTSVSYSYSYSQSGTAYYIVVPSGSSAPTESQIKAAASYSGVTISASDNSSSTANVATNFSITGLTSSTSYVIYAVTETSTNVFSSISNSSFTTSTVVTTPSAPTISSITSGNQQLSVNFTAGSNGGASISNYQYSIDGGSTFTAFSPAQTTSPLTITGLTNQTTYSISLKAVNSQGAGTASTSVTGTPSTVPDPPTSLSSTSSSGSVTISFTAGSNGGASITNYKYSTNGTTYTALSPSDATSPISISGLTNGTTYTIYLKAVNANGDSVASSSVSATPATTPGAPTINSISAGSQSLSVAFSAPGSNGGATITNYKYSTDGGSTFSAFSPAQTTSPLTITGLTGGTTYSVQIIAVNSAGDGTSSNSVNGTPNSPVSNSGSNNSSNSTSSPTPTPTPTPTATQRPTNIVSNPLIIPSPTPTPTPTQRIVPGSPNRPSALIKKLISELIDSLKPKIIDLTQTPMPQPEIVINSSSPSSTPSVNVENTKSSNPVPLPTFNNQQALELIPTIPDKKVVELPSLVLVNEVPEPSKIVIVENTIAQIVTPGGGLLNVAAKDGDERIPVDNRGRVQMVRENNVETEGKGMAPNTEFAVYLFSEPILLGVGKTDNKGQFFATFPVESALPIGDHTLQVNGLLPDGKTASISMPVTVVDSIETAKNQAMPKTIFVSENPVDKALKALYWMLIVLAVIIFLIAAANRKKFFALFRRRDDDEEPQTI